MARFNVPITQLSNDDGSGVASGWKLNFYETGTSTRKDTFSDSALTSANANPVVADSSGRFGDIFLESGTYKVVLTDAADVQKWAPDPVEGTAGSSGAVAAKTAAYTVTVGDATKLIDVDASAGAVTVTLPPAATAGDGFEVGVRKNGTDINAVTTDADGAETINGTATRALYRDGETEWYRSNGTAWFVTRSFLGPAKGTDIASAATTSIATATGNYVDITGTVTTTALGTAPAGTERIAQYDGALTLTHNATSLILPGAANIVTAAGDVAAFISLGSGNWKCVGYLRANGANVGLPRSYGAGCILSNDADADHDINVTAGDWRNAGNDGDLILASELTKQIDASWVAGDDAGGLSSSLTVANTTWYHVFLIEVAGAVDVGFDTSVTAANLIADHGATMYRRIGSRLTNGSANIIASTQRGDYVLWDVPQNDMNNGTINTTETLVTLSTPLGVRTRAILNGNQGGSARVVFLYSPDVTGANPSVQGVPVPNIGANQNDTSGHLEVWTNTSSQVAGQADVANNTDVQISTVAYADPRGRDD